MVGGDILWEMMVGCLEDGPKWCSILVSTTEVRTTLLFYIYGSWVSKRILILRDRIPNLSTKLIIIFIIEFGIWVIRVANLYAVGDVI